MPHMPQCHNGLLAPNALLRQAVSERAGLPVESEKAVVAQEQNSVATEEQASGRLYSSFWAMLLVRIFEINPLVCPGCGGEMKIIAFVTEGQPIGRILQHIGEPDHAPAISPARDPPIYCAEIDQTQYWDDNAANLPNRLNRHVLPEHATDFYVLQNLIKQKIQNYSSFLGQEFGMGGFNPTLLCFLHAVDRLIVVENLIIH